jgi:hypothetical protein
MIICAANLVMKEAHLALLANLLPATIPEHIADACLMAFTSAKWRERWRIERRKGWRRKRTERNATQRRQVNRAVAKRLHPTVDALTGTFGSRSSDSPNQQDNSYC